MINRQSYLCLYLYLDIIISGYSALIQAHIAFHQHHMMEFGQPLPKRKTCEHVCLSFLMQ